LDIDLIDDILSSIPEEYEVEAETTYLVGGVKQSDLTNGDEDYEEQLNKILEDAPKMFGLNASDEDGEEFLNLDYFVGDSVVYLGGSATELADDICSALGEYDIELQNETDAGYGVP